MYTLNNSHPFRHAVYNLVCRAWACLSLTELFLISIKRFENVFHAFKKSFHSEYKEWVSGKAILKSSAI